MDLTEGLERKPVFCENEIDSEPSPKNFTYVIANVMPATVSDLVANRDLQIAVDLVLHGTKGWGVHAAERIPAHSFICEYLGEVIDAAESRQRLADYEKNDVGHALLIIREVLPSGSCLRTNIDGTHSGNVSRFFNHSCDGGSLRVEIEREAGMLLPRVCFYAKKDICPGEELTFAYHQEKVMSCSGDGKLEKCYCGSTSCYGVLPNQ